MLTSLLLIACGGSDSFEMPEPSDIFDDGRSLLPHASAFEAGVLWKFKFSPLRTNPTENMQRKQRGGKLI